MKKVGNKVVDLKSASKDQPVTRAMLDELAARITQDVTRDVMEKVMADRTRLVESISQALSTYLGKESVSSASPKKSNVENGVTRVTADPARADSIPEVRLLNGAPAYITFYTRSSKRWPVESVSLDERAPMHIERTAEAEHMLLITSDDKTASSQVVVRLRNVKDPMVLQLKLVDEPGLTRVASIFMNGEVGESFKTAPQPGPEKNEEKATKNTSPNASGKASSSPGDGQVGEVNREGLAEHLFKKKTENRAQVARETQHTAKPSTKEASLSKPEAKPDSKKTAAPGPSTKNDPIRGERRVLLWNILRERTNLSEPRHIKDIYITLLNHPDGSLKKDLAAAFPSTVKNPSADWSQSRSRLRKLTDRHLHFPLLWTQGDDPETIRVFLDPDFRVVLGEYFGIKPKASHPETAKPKAEPKTKASKVSPTANVTPKTADKTQPNAQAAKPAANTARPNEPRKALDSALNEAAVDKLEQFLVERRPRFSKNMNATLRHLPTLTNGMEQKDYFASLPKGVKVDPDEWASFRNQLRKFCRRREVKPSALAFMSPKGHPGMWISHEFIAALTAVYGSPTPPPGDGKPDIDRPEAPGGKESTQDPGKEATKVSNETVQTEASATLLPMGGQLIDVLKEQLDEQFTKALSALLKTKSGTPCRLLEAQLNAGGMVFYWDEFISVVNQKVQELTGNDRFEAIVMNGEGEDATISLDADFREAGVEAAVAHLQRQTASMTKQSTPERPTPVATRQASVDETENEDDSTDDNDENAIETAPPVVKHAPAVDDVRKALSWLEPESFYLLHRLLNTRSGLTLAQVAAEAALPHERPRLERIITSVNQGIQAACADEKLQAITTSGMGEATTFSIRQNLRTMLLDELKSLESVAEEKGQDEHPLAKSPRFAAPGRSLGFAHEAQAIVGDSPDLPQHVPPPSFYTN